MIQLRVTFRFSSSHQLPNYAGKCSRLHGHNYRLVATVEGLVDPTTGMVADFHEIERAFALVLDRLDHHHLNEIVPNPTAENMVVWVWEQLRVPGLRSLELWETDDYSARYAG